MKKDAGLWFEVKSPIKQMNAQTLDQFLSEIEALTKDYPEYCEGVRILDGLECYFTYKIDGNIADCVSGRATKWKRC
jgi:hypothetical protein